MNTLFYPPDEMAFAVVHHDVVPHDVLLLLPSFIKPRAAHSQRDREPAASGHDPPIGFGGCETSGLKLQLDSAIVHYLAFP
jgi:hypothetical protein